MREMLRKLSTPCGSQVPFAGLPAEPSGSENPRKRRRKGAESWEKEEKLVLLASSVLYCGAKHKQCLEVTVKFDAFEKFRGKNDIMTNHSPPPHLFSSGSEK